VNAKGAAPGAGYSGAAGSTTGNAASIHRGGVIAEPSAVGTTLRIIKGMRPAGAILPGVLRHLLIGNELQRGRR
jgi:hypothetical protein